MSRHGVRSLECCFRYAQPERENRPMKKPILFAALLLLLVGAGIVFVALNDPDSSPRVESPGSGNAAAALKDDTSGEKSATPEAAATAKMSELKDPAERKEHLAWIAKQEWARSNLPVFRTTIVSDPDEGVQIAAVETALELARKEGGNATSAVVRTSLASTKGNTRARGLKAARENPDPALVHDMMELVDNNDPYATMALNALAYSDSREAHAKILSVAEDENAAPKLRQRAVALLAVTKDRDAYQLLVDLSNGEDPALSKLAGEVLRVLNEG